MIFDFVAGSTPVLISVPHAGTRLPGGLADRLARPAGQPVDTDWHVHRLYAAAPDRGVSMLRARYSRYVVDLNRPPDDAPLYAGATTGLVPVETFDGEPLYDPDDLPGAEEIDRRREVYWRPYHERIETELARLCERCGHAVLLDAHSIRSEVPRLFEGRLPDLNLGSNNGESCDSALAEAVWSCLAGDDDFTAVRDGRFRGGYITRHYGRPREGVHALQLEIAQSCYMDEDRPETFDPARAQPLMQRLEALVELLAAWRPA